MVHYAILLLLIGIALATVELFVPGFGVFGVLGVLAILTSALINILYVPFGLYIVLGEGLLLAFGIYHLIKWAKSKQLYGSLVLKDILAPDKKEVENNEKLIGKEGVAVIPLRPFGSVEFNGVKLDAYSEGAFIPKGRTVTVVNVENGRIIVREMN